MAETPSDVCTYTSFTLLSTQQIVPYITVLQYPGVKRYALIAHDRTVAQMDWRSYISKSGLVCPMTFFTPWWLTPFLEAQHEIILHLDHPDLASEP